ncbi:hypothetical protein DFH11DRAFT_1877904 [Phellopilus nigrolimitatus]|nr:hypothetical protein DFH11DRAFT_1877904 [Phellopilus nigrolimitatus]
MASTKDETWERAAKQPTFEVAPQLPSSTRTPQQATTRNMKPCRNCADMRKKCNMLPPYSSGNCESCDMARVSCPPYRGRKPRENTRARLAQNSPLLGNVSDVLQSPSPSDNKVAEVIQLQTTSTTGAPGINAVAETSNDDAAADAPASQMGGFDGLIFPDPSFDLFSLFESGRVDSFM